MCARAGRLFLENFVCQRSLLSSSLLRMFQIMTFSPLACFQCILSQFENGIIILELVPPRMRPLHQCIDIFPLPLLFSLFPRLRALLSKYRVIPRFLSPPSSRLSKAPAFPHPVPLFSHQVLALGLFPIKSLLLLPPSVSERQKSRFPPEFGELVFVLRLMRDAAAFFFCNNFLPLDQQRYFFVSLLFILEISSALFEPSPSSLFARPGKSGLLRCCPNLPDCFSWGFFLLSKSPSRLSMPKYSISPSLLAQ